MHESKRVLLAAAACGAAAAAAVILSPGDRLHAATAACDRDNGGIKLPQGFCAVVAADAVGAARHITVASNGDVYVALQQRGGDSAGFIAMRDSDGDGKLDQKEMVTAPGGGTGIALRNDYLYVATPTAVVRWKMTKGQLKPTGDME